MRLLCFLLFLSASTLQAIAIDPQGARLYFVDVDHVSVLDAKTLAPEARIPFSSPFALALDTEGSHLYVADGDHISVLDAATLKPVMEVPALQSQGIAAAARLYLVNQIANRVSVFDPATWIEEASFLGDGLSPRGIAVHGTRLYLANESSNDISVIDTTTLAPIEGSPFSVGGVTPTSIAIHPDGSLVYVANASSNDVSVLDGVTMQPIAGSPFKVETLSLSEIAIHPDGERLYLVDMGTVSMLDASTMQPVEQALPSVLVIEPGQQQYVEKCALPRSSCLQVDAGLGYFFFADATMRKIFDQGGLDVRLNASYPLWKCMQLYGSVEYIENSGKSLNGHQATRFRQVPLSLGIKSVIPLWRRIDYYFTLGPRYFFVWAHNNSSYVDKSVSQNGLGGFANMGLHFYRGRRFSFDVFGEYSYKRMRFSVHKNNAYGRTAQIGGFTFGANLNYTF